MHSYLLWRHIFVFFFKFPLQILPQRIVLNGQSHNDITIKKLPQCYKCASLWCASNWIRSQTYGLRNNLDGLNILISVVSVCLKITICLIFLFDLYLIIVGIILIENCIQFHVHKQVQVALKRIDFSKKGLNNITLLIDLQQIRLKIKAIDLSMCAKIVS